MCEGNFTHQVDAFVQREGMMTTAPLIREVPRPKTLAEFPGQDHIKESLTTAIRAAKQMETRMPHALFHGPPGLGKTTLCNVIANEMQTTIVTTSGPAIAKAAELTPFLMALRKGDILFIDEIHRLPRAVEEVLYPAMEDGQVDVMGLTKLQKAPVRVNLPPFTLVGATTRFALLTEPLRDRFQLTYRLDYYDIPTMETIVKQSAVKVRLDLPDNVATMLAYRSRGTPRVANNLLLRARDYAIVEGDGTLTDVIALKAFRAEGVDAIGLNRLDKRLLNILITQYNHRPVGLETLAASLAEDKGTVEYVIEPYLLRLGLIQRTARGRVATRLAYGHLGFAYPED